ncbi:uncharacterized protein LOC142328923 [Lycorma delicatula]|uniref:uncharacterized protein LOC142328923 n=1 Tax=Lycorma delicatula TaxID=130591 RepID=UPI003F51103F
MRSTLVIFSFVILSVLVFPSEEICERDQVRQGCRIHQGHCVCGAGCYSEYRYNNKEECRKALKGRRNDFCQRNPCLHQGICIQTIQEPGFRCRCESTGYYGTRCQHACPKPGVIPAGERVFPYQCIVI